MFTTIEEDVEVQLDKNITGHYNENLEEISLTWIDPNLRNTGLVYGIGMANFKKDTYEKVTKIF
ncbi:hypothetical protein [Aquibacillus kalidii]|uniref:hypothetical protein n=1 Tax=Aquibacillus kalidii TaxID=2762597 RepID=UPI0016467573|nr:hypothetical protein [Aquibacillus kalidii]